jgi:hypothetical protein
MAVFGLSLYRNAAHNLRQSGQSRHPLPGTDDRNFLSSFYFCFSGVCGLTKPNQKTINKYQP